MCLMQLHYVRKFKVPTIHYTLDSNSHLRDKSPDLTSSFAVLVITMATRGCCLTRNVIDLDQYKILSNIVIFAIICNIFHNIKYRIVVMVSSDFYFENKMHAELSWQWRQHASIFGKLARLGRAMI